MIGLSLVNSFDIHTNFWKRNPQFKALEPFKTLYVEDTDKNKVESSNLMWGLAFYCDPESILKNLPIKYKVERVKREFGGIDITLDEYKPYLEAFEELCLSEAERSLRSWEDKMQERTVFINSLKYTLKDADSIDKLLIATPKLYTELQRIKEQVLKETSIEGQAMGGIRESASDRGDI